jgi:hypothetical protein
MKVEIDEEAAESIVVQSLKEQYILLKSELEKRCDSDENSYSIFHNDKEEDIAAIKGLLKSLEDVLRYNMFKDDYTSFILESQKPVLTNR